MAPGSFRSTTPELLPDLLVQTLIRLPHEGPLRVAVDGPGCAGPGPLADEMAGLLRAAGRAPVVIRATDYWRDASVRLEFGRTDVDSYFQGWLDHEALRREVLRPLGPGGDGRYLPALRDADSNRSVRAAYVRTGADAVVMVAGDLLLGRGLPFEHTIHLAVSPAARRRRTAPEWAWTLPALDRYDDHTAAVDNADTVVSWTDPARPAVRTRPRRPRTVDQ